MRVLTYLQRILALLGVVGALAMLGWLLNAVLGSPLEAGLHLVRMDQLDQARRVESELDRQIQLAPLQLQTDDPGLRLARAEMAASISAMNSGRSGLRGLNSDIDRALKEYDTTLEQRAVLLDAYTDQVERLSLLLESLGAQLAQVLNSPGLANQDDLQRRLRDLLDLSLNYAVTRDSRLGDDLASAISALQAKVQDLRQVRDRELLSNALQTASSLSFTRDEVMAQIERIRDLNSDISLRGLHDAYAAFHGQLRHQAEVHRRSLAVYAVCLLLAFGLIGWRLRASFSALDKANSELNHTNTHLEELVQERTVDLNQALDNLRTQQTQLIQSEKMASLGQMVAGVAHEINTPLGYASSNVETVRELLAEQPLDAETISDFDMLLADSRHGMSQIAELVLSLKDFSRVDRSRNEAIDLNSAMDTALKICNNQLKDRVEVVREYTDLPKINCAPSQINQVFLNLINNAAQAIDGAGKIRLRTRAIEDGVEVEVADTGAGMDEQTQAHIFEPFFTTKPVGEGTGLGLSIVFRIIEDHGGDITVKSAPGKGTHFTVRLPLVAKQDTAPAVTENEQTAPAAA